ncbi:hypothetical protein ABZW30_31485 [Kitasatospora sp. NPDC004669]|uniref:hypothetical protein n=1 Tax=Kitasatospora sp. NPDC004669 TaxID=3154555 RepID=UPI0033BDF3CF
MKERTAATLRHTDGDRPVPDVLSVDPYGELVRLGLLPGTRTGAHLAAPEAPRAERLPPE